MKMLAPLTEEELKRAEERLIHPAPGSGIEAAAKYGIDLTLVIEQLRMTPAQRIERLQAAATELEKVRGIARKR